MESPRDPLPADVSAEPEPADPPPAEISRPEPAAAVPRPRDPGAPAEPLRLGEPAESLPPGAPAEPLPPGDADLIAASRAGDAAAYDTRYRRHVAATPLAPPTSPAPTIPLHPRPGARALAAAARPVSRAVLVVLAVRRFTHVTHAALALHRLRPG